MTLNVDRPDIKAMLLSLERIANAMDRIAQHIDPPVPPPAELLVGAPVVTPGPPEANPPIMGPPPNPIVTEPVEDPEGLAHARPRL